MAPYFEKANIEIYWWALKEQGSKMDQNRALKPYSLTSSFQHPGIKTVSVDLADWNATKQALKEVGPIDLLVNSAGVSRVSHCLEVKEQDYDLWVSYFPILTATLQFYILYIISHVPKTSANQIHQIWMFDFTEGFSGTQKYPVWWQNFHKICCCIMEQSTIFHQEYSNDYFNKRNW